MLCYRLLSIALILACGLCQDFSDSESSGYNLFLCALQNQACQCTGKILYTKVTKRPGVTLSDLRAMEHAEISNLSDNYVWCNKRSFSKDPAPGEPKQCVCHQTEDI